MKTIEQIALESLRSEFITDAVGKQTLIDFAKQFLAAWLAQQEPVAWISNESKYRLKHGGNSKGTVPVHLMRSSASKIPLFLAPPPAVPEGYVLVPKEPVAWVSGHLRYAFERTERYVPITVEVSLVNMGWKNQIPLYLATTPAPKGEQE